MRRSGKARESIVGAGDGCANAFALYPTPAGETVGNHIRGINRVMGRRERKGW